MPAQKPTLILASGSPQRRNLLAEAGYEFRSLEPSERAECGICSQETPGELVARLARQKAADVIEQLRHAGRIDEERRRGSVVVACDTVAECLGQVLGKPEDRAHAERMLRLLSGREHRVYSGLCVWPLDDRPQVQVATTRLRMDSLSAEQLAEYLDSRQWEGKAGAFGYQDRAGWLHIESGSESNVVGLPLELLGEMLAAIAA
jgi:septum formation protein